MSDMPERIRVWCNEPGNEVVISELDQPYPTGSREYVRKDIADAAVKAERERCAERFANHDFICMKHYAKGWRHDVYDAIRKGEQP
jgi:hypothetical protein